MHNSVICNNKGIKKAKLWLMIVRQTIYPVFLLLFYQPLWFFWKIPWIKKKFVLQLSFIKIHKNLCHSESAFCSWRRYVQEGFILLRLETRNVNFWGRRTLPFVNLFTNSETISNFAKENLNYLKELELTNSKAKNDIDLLIGPDFYWLIVTGNVTFGNPGETVGVKTVFGWVLNGSLKGEDVNGPSSTNFVSEVSSHVLSIKSRQVIILHNLANWVTFLFSLGIKH